MSENKHTNVGGIISVLIFLGIAAWWYFGGGFQPQAPNKGVSTGLSVSGARIKSGEFNVRSVVGTVKNTATKTYGYVQVSINLYDASGKQVGSTMANVNNLEPGTSWDFEAVILEDSATTFKVMDVTGL
jgi:hypothetical protein